MANGLLVVKSNEDLAKEEQVQNKALIDAQKPIGPMTWNLAGYVRKQWESAKREKVRFQDQILKNMRARNGIYDPDKLAEIRQIGAPEIYMMITDAKTRSAEAWVKDIVSQPGTTNPPFAVEPTPIPTVPPEIDQQFKMQYYSSAIEMMVNTALMSGQPLDGRMIAGQLQAMLPEVEKALKKAILDWSKERCDEMTRQINDQFVEGGWYKAFSDCIPDIIVKTGIIKGPIQRKEKMKNLTQTGGYLSLDYKDSVVQDYERRSPLDIYPGPGGVTFNDTFLFDKLSYSPMKISSFIGLPGFIEKEVRAVLQECRDGKLFKEWTEIDQDRALAEGRNPDMIYDWDEIHVLEYWGDVQGVILIEWDSDNSQKMKDLIKDKDIYYPIHAFLIGNHIIKAEINEDPLGHKPYSKCSFVERPDSFWGDGLPELIADVQGGCNACARALLYNVGMASGPQVEINEDRLSDGERADLTPWKRWFVTPDMMLHSGKAIEFYSPPFVAEKLIEVFNFFLKLADEHSGVPAYAHGDPQVGGAGNTASGLSMLMTQAARGIKLLIKNIDERIIEDTVMRQFEWNVKQKKFQSIIGDIKIVAKGTSSLIAKEQQATRMTELLSITANQIDAQIMGIDGRKALLREVIRTHEVDPDKILPETPTPMMAQSPGMAPMERGGQTLNAAGEPAQGTDFQTTFGRGGQAQLPTTQGPAGP